LALKIGFAVMAGSLAVGLVVETAPGQVLVMAFNVIGMGFTWPTLEGLVSEDETPAGLQQMVGLYNVVWAGTAAVAYFVGGAILDQFGLKSLFYIPLTVQIGLLGLTFWLESRWLAAHASGMTSIGHNTNSPKSPAELATGPFNPRPVAKAKMFQRLAWLANPFAYIAINTLLAVIPGIAVKLKLSTMLAGFCCSVWCFARLAAFLGLWFWDGWHYRFRWMLLSYCTLIITFAVILLVPNLAILVLAQILFGAALGLIYYSSLFYSMDLSLTKAEHGGIHEAAIGLGNFAGPAVGAASLYLLPQHNQASAIGVSLLLVVGLGGLFFIRRTTR
jgi:MFS family permease